MVKITGIYEGEKHCSLIHTPSNSKIETDAPKDNNGRGEAFSPTDLVAAALGSCMMTVMAIYAEKNNIDLSESTFTVEKIMKASPRMIETLNLAITMSADLTNEQRETLEGIALTCPVKQTLHPDVRINTSFIYV